MEINKRLQGEMLIVDVIGKLNTITTPELENSLKDLTGITSLVLNFDKLEYISSAGLRALLNLYKTMEKQGTMVLRNVHKEVKDVFVMTGFVDILTIE